jgi:signal transduction histidine kinase
MKLIYNLAHSGVQYAVSPSHRRSILLSNIVSMILFLLGMLLFAAYHSWYGWSVITVTIPLISLASLSALPLNKLNYSVISRLWLCLMIPIATLTLSVYAKIIYYDMQEELDYFTFRFIILASCVFPAVFFSFREKKLLFATTALNFLILILHDPVHSFFGVPYQGHVLKETNYAFTNVVITVTYIVLVSAVLFLKKISEDSELKAAILIRDLNQINEELVEKNTEIEAQNTEITAQTENLNVSQSKLQSAYKIIAEQKDLLLKQNRNLSTNLEEINNDLTATNSELIKHNNELRQFSYTVSHNLRGPVASLMGLLSLMDEKSLNEENTAILSHAKTSMMRLDHVIKDLSKIIDIRQDIYQIRQRINLKKEISDLIEALRKEIDRYQVTVKIEIDETPEIYSVKPMVHSILYNLITNAIKYRSMERTPEITIRCLTNDYYILQIEDNGLGIDLKNYRQNIFKLYKRFHYHTEGKGLGLYLVKLQAEALGGHVEVESEVNKFTRFSVYLSKPENVERQILYQEPYAQIFYDALLNSTGVIWKGPVSSEQYRSVFLKCLEFVKAYNTPNYISDLSNQGYINRDDQQWMFQNIMPDAARHGLKRIAVITPEKNNPAVLEYLNGINENLARLGLTQQYFATFKEACDWIGRLNEHVSITNNR